MSILAGARRRDAIPQKQDGLQRSDSGDSIELLLLLGQFGVRHQIRMTLGAIVALGTIGPALANPLGRAQVVSVLGEPLREPSQRWQQLYREVSIGFGW